MPKLYSRSFLAFLLLVFVNLSVNGQQVSFSEESDNMGISHSVQNLTNGSGSSFYDFNGDGLDDVTLGNGHGNPISFYVNNGSGFTQIPALVPDTGATRQILWADYDNDGDQDLYIVNYLGMCRLYRNDAGTMTDVTVLCGLDPGSYPNWAATWGDYDRDGWLDLYLSTNTYQTPYTDVNVLYRNNGDGTFTNWAEYAGVTDPLKNPLVCSFLDFDNDRWADIYLAQDKFHGNVLFRNEGNGKFQDVSVSSAANVSLMSMSCGIGDYDNNGYLDMYITNGPPGNALLENQGNGTFVERAVAAGVAFNEESWGANFCDFDNDMDQDLYVSGGVGGTTTISAAMYVNQGSGNFIIPTGIGMDGDTAMSYSNAIGDFNEDGHPDILVSNAAPYNTHLWQNTDTSGHWLKVHLRGTISNADAVGARIEAWTNGLRQIRERFTGVSYIAQNSATEHIGLGSYTTVDSLRVLWPSGHTDVLYNVSADQKVQITEGQTGDVMPLMFHIGSPMLCDGDSLILHVGRYSSFLWSTGETTQHISVDQPGSYWVTTTDSAGNMYTTDTLVVTSHTLPVFTVSSTATTCYGGMDGTAMATPSNPGNYSYWWSDSSMSASATGLAAGMYTVIVTDSIGCDDIDTVTVANAAQLLMTETLDDPTCNGDMDGSIGLAPQNGQTPFTYAWSTGGSGNTLSGLGGGMYSVTFTDGNGCMDSLSFSLTDPALLVLTGSSTADNGQGTGTATVSPAGGVSPYTYLWDDGGAQTSATATGLASGMYNVIVTDANGCSDTLEVEVSLVIGVVDALGSDLEMYPNPGTDRIVIRTEAFGAAAVTFEARDLSGKLVWQTTLDLSGGQAELAVPGDLSAGMYILSLENAQARAIRSWIRK